MAIVARKPLIFKTKMSHMKKLLSFQLFGNISTDSNCPEVKFFKTGLIHPYIQLKNSQITKTSNCFDEFFALKTVF